MTKLSVIFFILKQRIPNIILLSIMFSSLIIIFMVGIGVQNVFYNYLRSSYGNIPEYKIKLSDISDEKILKLRDEMKQSFPSKKMDALLGFETMQNVSLVDGEGLMLTRGLDLFIKGLKFKKDLMLQIDGKLVSLPIERIEYQEEMSISLHLNGQTIKDPQSVQFISTTTNEALEYGFCKKISVEDDLLTIQAIDCKTKSDDLQDILEKDNAKSVKIELDGNVFETGIIFNDTKYQSLVLDAKQIKEAKNISLSYKDIEIDNSMVSKLEVSNNELIVDFRSENNTGKKYKLFLSKILRDFINYNRMVLKLQLHAFEDDDASEKQDKELVYLDELTDLIDLIFAKEKGNLAISSTFLAQDLNNFGILDNFNIQTKDGKFDINIRSTLDYHPEKLYDKNILIVNKDLLDEQFQTNNKNNFIDLYLDESFNKEELEKLSSIIKKYDTYFKIISQDEIIPSIGAKKVVFNAVVFGGGAFILVILFIAMYIVLRQFYSNFSSELSLLKLYGSKIPFQAFINSVSFFISAVLNYIFLLQEEEVINKIMLQYFFIEYQISIVDYFISIGILLSYVVAMYYLEYQEIKKLNLIKGQ